jgi:hypothetical protein
MVTDLLQVVPTRLIQAVRTGLQINIWLDRTFVRSLLILVGHNLNLVGQKPTSLNLVGHIRHKIYISHKTSMYSHSGTTLSIMLECLVNFIAKYKLSEFAIGFCHSKKMYNVTIFLCERTNVRSKSLLLGHLLNLVGHCPMSDSNLQPCRKKLLVVINLFTNCYVQTISLVGTTCCKSIDLINLVTRL